MRTIAIIQARMGSSRLPGKVLMDLHGETTLGRVVMAARAIAGVDTAVVATSAAPSDDPVAAWCEERNIGFYRGPEDDVLERMRIAAKGENAEIVMRLTADCPLLDPAVCGQVLLLREQTNSDYASNVDPATWPDGLDCEVFTMGALSSASQEATAAADREHVTPFIRRNRGRFKVANLGCSIPGLQHHRWTLDTERDLKFLRAVLAELPKNRPVTHPEVLAVLRKFPELSALNKDEQRNAGSAASASGQVPENRTFTVSDTALARACKSIPLGSQTFSKSAIQLPAGETPYFLSHGDGGRVWDVDGNAYVDLGCGLLSVTLGYRDPDVDAAIRDQMNNGISFSLATELETQLAERLIEIIPCAEMVRFGKNGSDATSGCIRVARAATGRDRVAVCGYHGWQEWYIGATSRNKGIPKAVSALTHPFPYNDLDALHALLKQYPGEFAAVIMEPMSTIEPAPGYHAELAALARQHGALFVFDEIVTGFRYSLGGAQEYFGVTPDLAAFGKGMGNGMPISAVVGRADLMAEMGEVFFSSTFGGETLSLAASIAVIDKMRREPVIEKIWQTGQRLATEVTRRVAQHDLQNVFTLCGKAPWTLVAFQDHPAARKEAIRTLWMREMTRHGVLTLGSHNICYAHDDADMATVVAAWDHALSAVRVSLDSGALEEELTCPVIEPIFRVR